MDYTKDYSEMDARDDMDAREAADEAILRDHLQGYAFEASIKTGLFLQAVGEVA